MRWVVLGVVVTSACGGVSSTSKHDAPGVGGSAGQVSLPSGGVATSSGAAAGTGGSTAGIGGAALGIGGTQAAGTGGIRTTAGTGGGAQAAAGTGGEPALDGAGIVPEALAGCRGPSDPGCGTCYVVNEGVCSVVSGGTEMDYQMVAFVPGSCPPEGPFCAQCQYGSERSLRTLRGLGPPSDCDCSVVDPGIDPCHEPDGCGCYCNALSVDSKLCPSLDN